VALPRYRLEANYSVGGRRDGVASGNCSLGILKAASRHPWGGTEENR
jgi:hypothetical protein